MNPPLLPDDVPEGHRSGYVALVGKPNVGKSTLMNALVGRKLSIVTHKPQTTRHRVLGILSAESYQIIFLDTPGIIKPRYRLHESMMHDVTDAVMDADLLVFMADARRSTPDEFSLELIKDRPAILAVNKMDLIRQVDALPLVESYMALRDFDAVVPISAAKGSNLDVLLETIVDRLQPGPPFYPKEMITEHPERFFVAEIVREKIFEQYREEIPYSVQVNIVQFEEREGEKDFVSAEIVVGRDAQKGILIGKGGSALKRLGTAARKDIEAFLERSVYLDLHVKVRDDWRDRAAYLRSYGYRT
jgi:GTP-binding protein Era